MVNNLQDSSSSSSGSDDGDSRGEPQSGDFFVGPFGDGITCKENNTLRIGFQNVGGFLAQRGKIKEDMIRLGLNKWEFDIFGFAETNLDWRTLKEE
jgi:hypothetical protein